MAVVGKARKGTAAVESPFLLDRDDEEVLRRLNGEFSPEASYF
jgi:hypothetical protein